MLIDNCQLEVDEKRGVVYVHHPKGYTAIRICGLQTAITTGFDQLDITITKDGKVYVSKAFLALEPKL